LTRDRLQQAFGALRQRLGLTAVFVTHDVAEAVLLADRIGVMRGGRLVQLGTAAELARQPADADVARLVDTPRRQSQLVAARLEARS
jgi:osmoprotectant transport system ATP-binding protein